MPISSARPPRYEDSKIFHFDLPTQLLGISDGTRRLLQRNRGGILELFDWEQLRQAAAGCHGLWKLTP